MSAAEAMLTLIEIDEAVAEIARCFDGLPPKTKARLVLLAHSLGNLRRKVKADQRRVR